MKTDKLFYRLFLSQPSLIHELIPTIPADCDFDYSAPVIKDTEFRLDGLLTPISDNPNLPLIFLECQMQKDTEFYSRYLAEIFLYLNQYKVQRPWYGLLILQNRNQDLGSDIPYQSLLNSQVKRLYLEDLLPVQDLIQAILKSKFPQLTIEEIVAMFDLKTAIINDEPDAYEEFIKIVEKRGKQEGESELVIRLLKRRCGIFSMTLENQVRSLSIPQLESLGEALLDFQSLADLENWLEQNLE